MGKGANVLDLEKYCSELIARKVAKPYMNVSELAAYLGKDNRTVISWEKKRILPARNTAGLFSFIQVIARLEGKKAPAKRNVKKPAAPAGCSIVHKWLT